MKNIIKKLKSISFIKYYLVGKEFLNDPYFLDEKSKCNLEKMKTPKRTEILNFLLSTRSEDTRYLEIGVRNPNHNYNHIIADKKTSVDPGAEYIENPVDFKVTSDKFFEMLSRDEILSSSIKFDVIFIDGLHLADQANRDIVNSLKYIKDDGFIVLHDCNPPTEWNARENFNYHYTPAGNYWNGTTWKAFLKWRYSPLVHSCCIDSDWGVGIISKKALIGSHIKKTNPFFEFADFNENKTTYLNLISFNDLKILLKGAS